MNNLLKAAARKHALARGVRTAKWETADFENYIAEHGITERDNLKKAETKLELAEELDQMTGRKEQPKAGSVETAIQQLIAATDAGLDEARVIELIEKHSTAPRPTKVTIVKADKTEVVRDGVHKDYPLVQGHIAAGVSIAAVGPAGSGKSTMFKQIAADLGLKYYITGAIQQEHKIMGYMDANGVYQTTPFREAYEHGGLFVFEEFDGSAAKALLSANNALANEETDFPDGMVKRHPDFVAVMAGNTYGTGASRQYVGRTKLDDATLDRFCFIEIGYDESIEMAAALAANPDARNWVLEVQAFRAKVEKAGVKHVVSPRASIMGAKLLKQGLPLDVVRKTALHKSLGADQLRQLAK